MQDRRTVLILSQSGEGRTRLRRMLSLSKDLEVADAGELGPQGVASARRLLPDVIIVDSGWGEKADLDFIRSLTSAVPTSLLMLVAPDEDMEYVQGALLGGARGFVTRSSAESDLVEAVDRVLQLETTKRLQQAEAEGREATPGRREGKVVSVFSAKGGVGCTVIAVNLAVALRRQTGQPVSLFDANLRFGNAAVLLNLWPRVTLGDLARYEDDLSRQLVEEVMLTHSSGLRVLLPPPTLEAAEEITPPLVTGILEILKGGYEFIVVDTGAYLDSIALAILDSSFRVVLATTPEVPALHNLRRMLQLIDDLGYPRDKLVIVGNRFSATWGIKVTDIAESLGSPISVTLPSDGRLVTQAANRGIPFVLDARDSGASRAIYELAELLIKAEPQTGNEEEPRSRRGRY
ncbi:MAG: AAA family ATPase [Anaerolineae bacterium]